MMRKNLLHFPADPERAAPDPGHLPGEDGLAERGQASDLQELTEPVETRGSQELTVDGGAKGSLDGKTGKRRAVGKGCYRASWVFLGLQAVTILLTVLLLHYFLQNFEIVDDSVAGAIATGLVMAIVVGVGIILGTILFVVFGVIGLILSHRAVRTGQGGKAARGVRLATAILTGLGILFLLLMVLWP